MLDVMVVDDSATIRAAIRMILQHAGHRVREAQSAEHALSSLEAGPAPELFILDLNMPGMNGIELVRRLRAVQRHRFTPVLLLTTESGGEPRKLAKQAGASGWIVKPVASADLVRVIGQVCPKAHHP